MTEPQEVQTLRGQPVLVRLAECGWKWGWVGKDGWASCGDVVVTPTCVSRSKIVYHYWTFDRHKLQESRVFGEERREITEVYLPKAARHQAAYLDIDVFGNAQDTSTRGTWGYRG